MKTYFVKIGDRVINPALIASANLSCVIDRKTNEQLWGCEVRLADGRCELFYGKEADIMRQFLAGNNTYDLDQIYGTKPEAKQEESNDG